MTWGLLTIIGPILLIGAIAWAMLRNRKDSSPNDLARTEQATRDLYDRSDADDAEDARKDPLTTNDD